MITTAFSTFKNVAFGVFLGILALGAVYFVWASIPDEQESPAEQISEVTVPADEMTDDWAAFTDPASHVAFEYPEDLGTTYTHIVDWPPRVAVLDQKFACDEGGASEAMPAGQTLEKTINGSTYCVTKVTEGAAGSIYTSYAYATAHEDTTMIFTFSLRTVQCGNYDEPQQTACEVEQETFNLDSLVDRMVQSAKLM